MFLCFFPAEQSRFFSLFFVCVSCVVSERERARERERESERERERDAGHMQLLSKGKVVNKTPHS